MTARRGYPAVDRFRVAAALLVVCIHTAPLASFFRSGGFCAENAGAAGRAVLFSRQPDFFLLGELMRPGLRPRTLSPGVRRFLKKTGVLYAACTVLYLPVTLYAGNFPVKTCWGACAGRCAGRHVLSPVPARRAAGSAGGVRAAAFLRPGAAAGVCGALYLAGLLGEQLVAFANSCPH